MHKTIILIPLIIISSIWCSHLQGQAFQPLSIKTPNVETLGKFTEIPIDYQYGLPNIEVPLHIIKSKYFEIPIKLRYHASGIKPKQYPGWVGQGWILDAGGSISRIVNSIPDESDEWTIMQPMPRETGYYYNTHLLDVPYWFLYPPSEDYYDTEPDEFSFNVNNLSGKFFLDHKGKWQVHSDQEVQVVFNLSDIKHTNLLHQSFGKGHFYYKFTLIGPDGSQYIFGGDTASIEFTRPEDHGLVVPIATTWHLTKIISADKSEEIVFGYDKNKDDLILTYYKPDGITLTEDSNEQLSDFEDIHDYHEVTSLLEPSYLESIETAYESVTLSSSKNNSMYLELPTVFPNEFDLRYGDYPDINQHNNTGNGYTTDKFHQIGRKLNKIEIFNKYLNSKTKNITLSYIENQTERLKLQGISIYNSDLTEELKYDLEYYNTGEYVLLPDYNTLKLDHWGFFTNNIPNRPYPTSIDQAETLFKSSSEQDAYLNSRNSSTDPHIYCSEMLKKITYPTKGYTIFEYENNDYSANTYKVPTFINNTSDIITGLNSIIEEPLGLRYPCGGTRIKKITFFDSDHTLIDQKEYFYIKAFDLSDYNNPFSTKKSSGVLHTAIIQSQDPLCQEEYLECLNSYNACCQECYDLWWPDHIKIDECRNEYCRQCTSSCMSYINPYFKKIRYPLAVNLYRDIYEFNALPFVPFYNQKGNHILYTEVTEVYKDHSYKKYIYNGGSIVDELPVSSYGNNYFLGVTHKDLEIHKLSEIRDYDNMGNLIKKNVYTYRLDGGRFNKAIRSRSKNNTIQVLEAYYANENLYYNFYSGVSNYIYYYNFHINSIKEEHYTPEGYYYTGRSYTYDLNVSDKLIIKEKQENIDNSYTFEIRTYPKNLISGLQLPYDNIYYKMDQANIQMPIEIISGTTKNNFDYINEAKLFTYKVVNQDMLKPETAFLFSVENSIVGVDFIKTYINPQGTLTYDVRYKDRKSYEFVNYDIQGNLNEIVVKGIIPFTKIYGYNNTLQIAEVNNARSCESGYTSFENNELNGWVSSNIISNSEKKSGENSLIINTTNGITRDFAIGLNAKEHSGYQASVYAKGSSKIYIELSIKNTNIKIKKYNDNGLSNWEMLKVEIPYALIEPYLNDQLIISVKIASENGSGYIDDLRFYPIDAQMVSYTYIPGIGLTSISDENNKANKFQYDKFGRIVGVSDFKNNLINKYKYNFK